ncbi:MAG: hypothetical protein V7K21_13420 [Nostoc sp.]|uniref:hypothetical protein n=1 Tax=Nostoc sp. TaxID=1180 RepID=UPI002FFA700B
MSHRKSENYLKAQLKYATARREYEAPIRELGSTGKHRQTQKSRYTVMSHPEAEALYYTIHGAIESYKFFTEDALSELGLLPPAADGNPPKGFKTAKIHATRSTGEGTVKHAKNSGRPYMSYQPNGQQSSYSAPITSPAGGIKGVVTLVKAIASAKKEVLGPYGRIWFTPEYYVLID